jgi:hypothetical protein
MIQIFVFSPGHDSIWARNLVPTDDVEFSVSNNSSCTFPAGRHRLDRRVRPAGQSQMKNHADLPSDRFGQFVILNGDI